MEVGRFSSIGSGELWMGTEAPLIAQNMHTTIMKFVFCPDELIHSSRFDIFPYVVHARKITKRDYSPFHSAMSACSRDELGPVVRNRSSSANEASKPVTMQHRRQTHVGNKPLSFSPVSGKFILQCIFRSARCVILEPHFAVVCFVVCFISVFPTTGVLCSYSNLYDDFGFLLIFWLLYFFPVRFDRILSPSPCSAVVVC